MDDTQKAIMSQKHYKEVLSATQDNEERVAITLCTLCAMCAHLILCDQVKDNDCFIAEVLRNTAQSIQGFVDSREEFKEKT